MGRGQRRRHLGDDRDCARRLEPPLRGQQRPQVRAVDVAHGQVERPALGAGVEDLDDVGMVERRGEPALALEARAEHAVAGQARRQQLERDRAVERDVGGAVDHPHSPAPGDGVDAVAGERRADGELLVVVGLRQGRRGEPRAQARVEVGAAGDRGADRLHELGVRRLLEHEAARPALQRHARELRVVVLGHHDDRAARRGGQQLGDRGQARPPRHVEVEQDHVRRVLARAHEPPVDVTGLADDMEVPLLLEQQPQSAADHRVVVDDQDPDRHITRHGGPNLLPR